MIIKSIYKIIKNLLFEPNIVYIDKQVDLLFWKIIRSLANISPKILFICWIGICFVCLFFVNNFYLLTEITIFFIFGCLIKAAFEEKKKKEKLVIQYFISSFCMFSVICFLTVWYLHKYICANIFAQIYNICLLLGLFFFLVKLSLHVNTLYIPLKLKGWDFVVWLIKYYPLHKKYSFFATIIKNILVWKYLSVIFFFSFFLNIPQFCYMHLQYIGLKIFNIFFNSFYYGLYVLIPILVLVLIVCILVPAFFETPIWFLFMVNSYLLMILGFFCIFVLNIIYSYELNLEAPQLIKSSWTHRYFYENAWEYTYFTKPGLFVLVYIHMLPGISLILYFRKKTLFIKKEIKRLTPRYIYISFLMLFFCLYVYTFGNDIWLFPVIIVTCAAFLNRKESKYEIISITNYYVWYYQQGLFFFISIVYYFVFEGITLGSWLVIINKDFFLFTTIIIVFFFVGFYLWINSDNSYIKAWFLAVDFAREQVEKYEQAEQKRQEELQEELRFQRLTEMEKRREMRDRRNKKR